MFFARKGEGACFHASAQCAHPLPQPCEAKAWARRTFHALASVSVQAEGQDAAIVALATMVGAVTLARALADPDASERILAAARAAIRTPAQG